MNGIKILFILLFLITAWSCEDRDAWRMGEEEVIELTTSYGKVHIWLYKETPLHRENFLKLAKSGFYDTTEFHRVFQSFFIQGGDPNSADSIRSNDGLGGPPWDIDAEIDSGKFRHVYGAIGAYRLDDAVNPRRNSHGSQFYIVSNPAGAHFMDGRYTVFGRVLGSMAMVDSLKQTALIGEQPVQRIRMDVEVVRWRRHWLEDYPGVTF
jgi:cyclophilin family peptidyl-prolyl cis-trans isomerase